MGGSERCKWTHGEERIREGGRFILTIGRYIYR